MEPTTLASLLAVLASEGLLAVDLQALGRGPTHGGDRNERRAGAVAVLPMVGPLMARTRSVGWSSAIPGMDAHRAALNTAARNPDVSAIVVEMDTPGGTVVGTAELAAAVRAAAEAKPVVVVANGICASAGYWIGSQGTQFVVAPGGEVGSIGVMLAHQDLSKLYERMGVQTTLKTAGAFKGEFSPYGPLTPEAEAFMQVKVDASHEEFLAAVAIGRRTSVSTVREKFGQGRMVDGPEAVRLGMADRVASLDTVIAELLQGERPRAARRRVDAFTFA